MWNRKDLRIILSPRRERVRGFQLRDTRYLWHQVSTISHVEADLTLVTSHLRAHDMPANVRFGH